MPKNRKRCAEPGCGKSAQGKTDKCIGHGGGKRCAESGCPKTAQGKTDRCKTHGGGRICAEPGCTKNAQGKTDRCKAHGGGTRCSEPGCTKSARSKSDKCIGHGGGTRCSEPGCTKSAREKTDKCKAHGGGRRCSEPGCTKSAVEKYDKCKAHGGGKRCSEPGCTNSATGRTDKCRKHGGGKRCSENGCTKSAQGKTDKCIEHGGGTRCPNCIDWPDSRSAKPAYDNYCATCFKRLFPDDPRSRVVYEHTKEIRVRNAIQERADNDTRFRGFVHDKPLYTGNCDCTHRRRVDHRKLIGNTILAIETDEYAHQDYDAKDEEIRYDDLYMIHSGKWIFIRFNPDKTRDCKVDLEDRISVLLDEIETHIERIYREENTALVEIHYLYYNSTYT